MLSGEYIEEERQSEWEWNDVTPDAGLPFAVSLLLTRLDYTGYMLLGLV